MRRCDIGLTVGWLAGLLRSGDAHTDTTPGPPVGWGRYGRARAVVFVCCFFSIPFAYFGNVEQLYDEYQLQSASTPHGDEVSTYTL